LRLVAHELEDLAHARHRRTVRQVAAVRQIHCQHRVARRQTRHVHGLIHRRAAQRLHVRVFGAEQGFGPFDRERFDAIGVGLAAVIATSRIAFRVLVGEGAAIGGVHLRECVVLGRNQFQAFTLTLLLADQCGVNIGVGRFQQVESRLHGALQMDVGLQCPGERPK
jgi:hypothetical protein